MAGLFDHHPQTLVLEHCTFTSFIDVYPKWEKYSADVVLQQFLSVYTVPANISRDVIGGEIGEIIAKYGNFYTKTKEGIKTHTPKQILFGAQGSQGSDWTYDKNRRDSHCKRLPPY